MVEIEKLFKVIPPKLILDHYWNVLDIISWRGLIGSKDKEHFTILDLRDKLLSDIHISENNPFHQRRCSRSIALIEETVNELVNMGLLVREGDIFRKTDDFLEFWYLLKKRVRSSVRRCIAWAVWYLHHHEGLTSFSTTELITLISYRDEEYVDEIPHIVVWKENVWFKLLEKHGDAWRLLEKPYLPSKSILVSDIDRRLFFAILDLLEIKGEFSTKEIIGKTRELEQISADKILKRLRLKYEDKRWQVDDKSLDKIKSVLSESEVRWPFLGVLVSKNPYFRLQSRTMYADIPNTTIWNFLGELERICYEHKDDKEKMYEKARELATTFNQSLEKDLGKWLLFVVRKQFFGSRPFGVQIKINWRIFHSFLDNFAERELPLRQKYSYILNCRAPSLTLVLRGDLERVQHEVKEICREEMGQIHQNLENLVNKINGAKDYLFKITSYRKTIPIEPSTLEYFPEMMSTLRALTSLVDTGTIPACYREMRKVLENLSWVIFDDMLLYKTSTIRKRKHAEELLIPYRAVSKEWYDWASQEKLTIRNLGELEKKIKDLTELVYLHGKNKGYSWDKKQIEKTLFKRISYPLFLLLTGINVQVPKKLEELIPQYEVEMLKSLAIEDLKNVLKDLGHKHLSKSDDALIEELMNASIGEASRVVPPYPSNEFVLGFMSKTLSNELLEPYKEYSHFVHSYFTSWHIFPFSSVLEFKVFRYELSVFTRIILQLINSYFDELFRSSP